MLRPTLAFLAALPFFAFAQPADQPVPRTDTNSQLAHTQLLEKAKAGGIDIYFEGDSITRRWGATDYPAFLENWKQNFYGWNAGDFGWGADKIENILWRLEHGELDGVNPKIIVILGGTNNIGLQPVDDAKVADITRGLRAVVDLCRTKAPAATIVLTAIFPRDDNLAALPATTTSPRSPRSIASTKTSRASPTEKRFASSTSTPASPTPTENFSTA